MVLIFCVEFQELFHLTSDLCQAEKKITVVTSWATDKMTIIFTQNDNFDHFEWNICHFVHLLSLYQHLFSSQLEISQVLNGTTPEIQHRKWGPKYLCALPKVFQVFTLDKTIARLLPTIFWWLYYSLIDGILFWSLSEKITMRLVPSVLS